MELYTVFRGNYRFMKGEYSEEQQKINGNFNEAYDLVVESLFGHQNSIRVLWRLGRKPSLHLLEVRQNPFPVEVIFCGR
jgi:hypothetical protein